ncbi:hypothetical protein Avbf_05155, partial [Armadillidium vulgare]
MNMSTSIHPHWKVTKELSPSYSVEGELLLKKTIVQTTDETWRICGCRISKDSYGNFRSSDHLLVQEVQYQPMTIHQIADPGAPSIFLGPTHLTTLADCIQIAIAYDNILSSFNPYVCNFNSGSLNIQRIHISAGNEYKRSEKKRNRQERIVKELMLGIHSFMANSI